MTTAASFMCGAMTASAGWSVVMVLVTREPWWLLCSGICFVSAFGYYLAILREQAKFIRSLPKTNNPTTTNENDSN